MLLMFTKTKNFDNGANYHLVYRHIDPSIGDEHFPCDAHGVLLCQLLSKDDLGEYLSIVNDACYHFMGISETLNHSAVPTEGKCECGMRVDLSKFVNTCVCKRKYIHTGQEIVLIDSSNKHRLKGDELIFNDHDGKYILYDVYLGLFKGKSS